MSTDVEGHADLPAMDIPTEADLTKLTKEKLQFIDRLLTVVKKETVPLTQQAFAIATRCLAA
ncbi:MAG: hypothetical protein P8N76_17675 [Pirellulaceae bacterium]|nr:hypothetical protein [Pirellulaceae bacterium]